MTSGPTSSEAEHVFAVATHTERRSAHMYIYMHTYLPVHTHHRQRRVLTKLNSTKSLIVFLSLVEQDGGSLRRICIYIYICRFVHIHTTWMLLAAGLRQPVCPVGDPRLLLMAPGHIRSKGHSPTPAGTDHLRHAHRAGQSSSESIVSNTLPKERHQKAGDISGESIEVVGTGVLSLRGKAGGARLSQLEKR